MDSLDFAVDNVPSNAPTITAWKSDLADRASPQGAADNFRKQALTDMRVNLVHHDESSCCVVVYHYDIRMTNPNEIP